MKNDEWNIRIGERYYLPQFIAKESERYSLEHWGDSDWENWLHNNNLIFKTKEEAIKATNILLETLKEDKQYE